MERMSARRAPRTLLLTLATFLLVFGGNVARSAHWLLVPHRLCETHGRWEHALAPDTNAAYPDGADEDGADEERSDRPSGPRLVNANSAHEECSLGACARLEPALALGESTRPAPERARLVRVERTPSARVSAVPLLLLAPKHSPPA